jgi:histidine triad (HIT) family protein
MENCIFCKIIKNEITAKKVYEDNSVLAFYDINPSAPVHILIIPKQHIVNTFALTENDKNLMGHIIVSANEIALRLGLNQGYKLHINTGKAGGQEVYHLHVHLLGNILNHG